MLYDRAKQLLSTGLSPDEVTRTLLAEGARPEDIKVVLGSLGVGPQPHPNPTQAPLAFIQRMMESRALRLVAFLVGGTAVSGFLFLAWELFSVVAALVEGFTRGP